jgi:hypothetical protein
VGCAHAVGHAGRATPHDDLRRVGPAPLSRAASFIPARAPRTDGDTWIVDIKRSDGVSRPSWNNGIYIKKLNGNYALSYDQKLLDEPLLINILDAIGSP